MRSITKSRALGAIEAAACAATGRGAAPASARAQYKASPNKHRSFQWNWLLILGWAIALPNWTLAQQNPLNRRISLDLTQTRLDDALDRIGQEGRLSFSYNAAMLRLDSSVSVHARNEHVRQVTQALLGPRYEIEAVGNHVVIRLAKLPPKSEDLPKNRDLGGYLIDAVSGEKVRFATVFETGRRTSVLTDPQGHYAITVPGNLRQVELSFSKKGYRDSVIVVDPTRAGNLTVGLQPIPGFAQPLATRPVTNVGLKAQESLPLVELFVPERQRSLADNIDERLGSFPFQISLVPSIGTNKLLSGGMDNNFSLNILAGYANGVNGVEIGGLANIDRANVKGLQVGGLVNIVGGNVKGLQVGGILNYVKGEVNGMQIGGIVNYVPNPVKGMQVAGIVNYVPADVNKVQIGGILNHGHNIGGFQVGGIVNLAKGNVGGFQIGGITNYANGNVGGFQIGGITNYAKGNVGGFQIGGIANYATGDVGGFQIGGIANIAKGNVSKSQVGGIVNKAGIVNGCQIGLINIADSVGGALIGLVNVVKKGYRVLEFSTNDVAQANISYKTGRAQFYNILTAGYRFGPGHFALTYGAGFGTSTQLGPLNLGFEATCNDVIEQALGPGRLNLWIPTRVSLGIPLGDHLEVFGGAALNLQVTNPQNGLGEFKSELGARPLWRNDGDRTRTQLWMGYQAGLRILLYKKDSGKDEEDVKG